MAKRPGLTPDILDVYARVSRLGDDRQRSTDGQVIDSSARVTGRGAQVGEVHIDSGRSAWNPRVHRPGWDSLMERLESGATGGVVVFDLARFSRRPIEGERLIAAAERGLLVLDSEDEYDLTSANGKKAFRDQMAGAAYESDRLSTRVARGKRLKALRGEPNSSPRPFGFEADAITIRQDEAAVLRGLVAQVLAGDTQQTMVEDLNRRGIRTSLGGPWTSGSLRAVLVRSRNAGLIEYLGEVVSRLPGQPIIPEETHNRITALFAARRRGRPAGDLYLCSGLIRCATCKHVLAGRPRQNMKPYPDGGMRREYWCRPRDYQGVWEGGCHRVAIDQRDLDEHVGKLAVRILSDPRHAAAVEAAAGAMREEHAELGRELAECDQLVEYLDGRLSRREITRARYDRMVAPLETQSAELSARLKALDAGPVGEVSPEVIAASHQEWQERWKRASIAERRVLARQALRGRRLLVLPKPDRNSGFDPERIVIAAPLDAQPAPARTNR